MSADKNSAPEIEQQALPDQNQENQLNGDTVLAKQESEKPGIAGPDLELEENANDLIDNGVKKSKWWWPFKKKKKKNAPDEPNAAGITSGDNRDTALHAVVNNIWGIGGIDEIAWMSLSRCAQPHSAKLTETGFEMMLNSGAKFCYTRPDKYRDRERIFCEGGKFDETSAAAIVAMARLRGWQNLNLQGSVAEREMLWLAAQRQNMIIADYNAAIQQAVKEGTLTEVKGENGERNKIVDKQGKEYLLQAGLTVANFTPLETSRAAQQWQQELAAWQKAHQAPQQNAPAEKKEEKQVEDNADKSAAEKKQESVAQTPDQKQGIETSSFVDAKKPNASVNDKSQFIADEKPPSNDVIKTDTGNKSKGPGNGLKP